MATKRKRATTKILTMRWKPPIPKLRVDTRNIGDLGALLNPYMYQLRQSGVLAVLNLRNTRNGGFSLDVILSSKAAKAWPTVKKHLAFGLFKHNGFTFRLRDER